MSTYDPEERKSHHIQTHKQLQHPYDLFRGQFRKNCPPAQVAGRRKAFAEEEECYMIRADDAHGLYFPARMGLFILSSLLQLQPLPIAQCVQVPALKRWSAPQPRRARICRLQYISLLITYGLDMDVCSACGETVPISDAIYRLHRCGHAAVLYFGCTGKEIRFWRDGVLIDPSAWAPRCQPKSPASTARESTLGKRTCQ